MEALLCKAIQSHIEYHINSNTYNHHACRTEKKVVIRQDEEQHTGHNRHSHTCQHGHDSRHILLNSSCLLFPNQLGVQDIQRKTGIIAKYDGDKGSSCGSEIPG